MSATGDRIHDTDFDFTKGGAVGQTPIDAPTAIRENWGWLALLGAALIIGGAFAVVAPVVSGIAASIAIGAVLLVCGACQAVSAFRKKGWRGQLWHGLSAGIFLIGGFLLAFQPFVGMVALSLLIVAIMIADGVSRIIMGVQVRPERGWGWIAASGLLSAAIGLGLALFALPEASLTLLGLFVGVSLIIEGTAFIYVAFAARPASDRTVTPDSAS